MLQMEEYIPSEEIVYDFERAKEIATLSFDNPLVLNREDELGELSKDLEIISTNLSNKIMALEDSEAYIRSLLNNLSHEFKTPLCILIGLIGWLLRQLICQS